MINNWSELPPEERMQKLLLAMREIYYKTRTLENLSDAIKIAEIKTKQISSNYFQIAIHSSIPTIYLEEDIPIFGMEIYGKLIAAGENKALVETLCREVSTIKIEEISFKNMLDNISNLGQVKALFMPIKYFTNIHSELQFDYSQDFRDIAVYKGNKFKVIYSSNTSEWDKIIFLGESAIEWTRKISKTLPPNIANYKLISKDDECLRLAYNMSDTQCGFYIGTVSNCQIRNPEKIQIYEIPEKTTIEKKN